MIHPSTLAPLGGSGLSAVTHPSASNEETQLGGTLSHRSQCQPGENHRTRRCRGKGSVRQTRPVMAQATAGGNQPHRDKPAETPLPHSPLSTYPVLSILKDSGTSLSSQFHQRGETHRENELKQNLLNVVRFQDHFRGLPIYLFFLNAEIFC